MEIYKDIEGFEGFYQVSNLGNIKSIKYNKIMKYSDINNCGYYRIYLTKDNIKKRYFIHRLVAEAFLSKVIDKNKVNHIDKNKLNNELSNLEWCNMRENTSYSILNKTSKYIGVHLRSDSNINKWRASIRVNKSLVNLGSFDTEEKASKAYNEYLVNNGLANKYA